MTLRKRKRLEPPPKRETPSPYPPLPSSNLKRQVSRMREKLLDYQPGCNYDRRNSLASSLEAAFHFYELRKGDKISAVELAQRMHQALILLEKENEKKKEKKAAKKKKAAENT